MYKDCSVQQAIQRAEAIYNLHPAYGQGNESYPKKRCFTRGPIPTDSSKFPSTDCSAFIATCWKVPSAVGTGSKDGGMLTSYPSWGFEYLPRKGTKLMKGDILVRLKGQGGSTSGHTAMVYNDACTVCIQQNGGGPNNNRPIGWNWNHILRSNNGGLYIDKWENKATRGGPPSFHH